MTLTAEHIEPDTRERILVVAERLFRQIGYQKTTVADIAKELRMSPANVYRFFDSKKAIHEGVARGLMGGVEEAAQAIAVQRGPAATRLRELMKTVHRMNSERYVGDSKMHEMVEIADHRKRHRRGRGVRRIRGRRRAADGDVRLHRDDAVLPSADDRPMCQQAGADDRRDDRFYRGRPFAADQGELTQSSVDTPVIASEAKQSIGRLP